MCGIAGILSLNGAVEPRIGELKAQAAQMLHRGPDGLGFYRDADCGLAHTRLSIIDLESGDQPIHNEEETIWVVFNGEVFNYVELRADLMKKGHHFYTQSDTEVMAHLYEEDGPEFVHRLNGQFAIALWDKTLKTLYLYRDRPGIAPLFYTERSGRLIFASEIKAMLPLFGGAPVLDARALFQLMTFWSPVSPRTVFEGVFEVPPGHMVTVRNGKVESKRYWDYSFPEGDDYIYGAENSLAEELHDLLVDSVRLRLRSDVPVGAYLSGGLDSSVITSLIHRYGGVPLRTFSIGFEDAALDELSFQKQMIDHLGADHSHVRCANAEVGSEFARAIWHTESPVLRNAPVPMRVLSGLVRNQGYKVVLTGEGADEMLGGYDIFKEAKIRQFWARNPNSSFRPLLLKKLYPYLDITKKQGMYYLRSFFGQDLEKPGTPLFSHLPRIFTTSKCKSFLSEAIKSQVPDSSLQDMIETLPLSFSRWHPFNRAQYLESKSLLPGYLLSSQGDRMLLSNSVEGRFPFLDHRVMEFASRLHPTLKMKVLNEKYLLKRAAGKYLPEGIVKRYKQPYRAPDIPAFFRGTRLEYAEELLGDKKIVEYGCFDAKKVGMLVQKAKSGRAVGYGDNMAFVGILSTQLWHYHFVERYRDLLGEKS